jgi:hypothetical protein
MFVSLSASTRKSVVSWNAGASPAATGTGHSSLCKPNSCGTAALGCVPILLLLRAPYFRIQVAFSDLPSSDLF